MKALRLTRIPCALLAGACLLAPGTAQATRFSGRFAGAEPAAERGERALAAFDLGCLASRDRTVSSNVRVRIAGPLLESQVSTNGMRLDAFHPFYSRIDDPAHARGYVDILWPLAQIKDLENQRLWRVLVAYGNNFDTGSASNRYRTVIFPLAAYGREEDGQRYFALFPFGGEVRSFLGQDRIAFVLFPCYLETELKDLKGHAVLWPLIAWADGPGVHRFRVFPFYGESTRTNEWEKRFVLWPFWTSVRYDYPNEKGGGFVLFPIVGHIETERQNTWMAIPPLFRYSRGRDFTELRCPWPFVQARKSPHENYLHLWPLWGHKESAGHRFSYAVWPVFETHTTERAGTRNFGCKAFPIFHYDSTTVTAPAPAAALPPAAAMPTATGTVQTAMSATATGVVQTVTARYWKVWPLMSYRREGDATRFRALDLWPMKALRGIEQNWAPLWTLYQQQADGAAREQELLWGLYRRQSDGKGNTHCSVFPLFSRDAEADGDSRWSLLGGLIGAGREGLNRTVRLLYILRLGGRAEPAADTPGGDPPAAGADQEP